MSARPDNPWPRRIFFTIFCLLVVMAWRRREQLKATLSPLFESIDTLGPWAPAILILLYIPACLCMVPNTLITPGVGFLLGAVTGTFTAIIGLTVGASATFLFSRALGRNWFHHRVPHQPRLAAIELACRRDGFKIVLLTRLTPAFPSNLMSYFFGVTGVSLSEYAAATAIGMFPRTIIYASIGAAAKSYADASNSHIEDRPWVQWAIYIGVAVTLFVVIAIARIARRALEDVIAENAALTAGDSLPATNETTIPARSEVASESAV